MLSSTSSKLGKQSLAFTQVSVKLWALGPMHIGVESLKRQALWLRNPSRKESYTHMNQYCIEQEIRSPLQMTDLQDSGHWKTTGYGECWEFPIKLSWIYSDLNLSSSLDPRILKVLPSLQAPLGWWKGPGPRLWSQTNLGLSPGSRVY